MPTHHILLYDYVDDIIERRGPYREGHLGLIQRWMDDGRVVMAGPLGDPVNGGLIVFNVEGPAEIEEFTSADPYGEAGLVAKARIEPWTMVT
jgi:uncharacterized protein YciI